jgi:hypothetical protein
VVRAWCVRGACAWVLSRLVCGRGPLSRLVVCVWAGARRGREPQRGGRGGDPHVLPRAPPHVTRYVTRYENTRSMHVSCPPILFVSEPSGHLSVVTCLCPSHVTHSDHCPRHSSQRSLCVTTSHCGSGCCLSLNNVRGSVPSIRQQPLQSNPVPSIRQQPLPSRACDQGGECHRHRERRAPCGSVQGRYGGRDVSISSGVRHAAVCLHTA